MSAYEVRLRREYVEGRIEIEEFEHRVGAILRGAPLPEDVELARSERTDAPGTIFHYTEVLKAAWTAPPPLTGTQASMLEKQTRMRQGAEAA